MHQSIMLMALDLSILLRKGLGPQDGFTEYKIFSPFGNSVPRPRWGDYGGCCAGRKYGLDCLGVYWADLYL